MSIIMGIDTGGTYTDAVIVDTSLKKVLHKSKALTTHENLSAGIESSITALGDMCTQSISRVILSTTLATNAIIENKGASAGVILIGRDIDDNLPCACKRLVKGEVDYRGNVTQNIDKDEIISAAREMMPCVDLIVVSCIMGVRNPKLELKAREIINSSFDIKVICSHEVECNLGYYQRTVTAILNGRLLEIITNFINAIETVLKSKHITAPLYIVKSDGSLLSLECVREKPVETMFSGPAASIAGAVYLSGVNDAIVVDIGGTTSDIGIVRSKRISISGSGAQIGKWKTHVKSAELLTIGLGGDSLIDRDDNGNITVGPERVTPSCRSSIPSYLTPTDILHCTGEYTEWNRSNALSALESRAEAWGMTKEELLKAAEHCIFNKIREEFPIDPTGTDLPVVAVGAPAQAWFSKASRILGFSLIIPDHFEVANAVGAAVACVHEAFNAIVRLDPQSAGYILFTHKEPMLFDEKNSAIKEALAILRNMASTVAKKQNVHNAALKEDVFDKYIDSYDSERSIYIETRISVTLEGSII